MWLQPSTSLTDFVSISAGSVRNIKPFLPRNNGLTEALQTLSQGPSAVKTSSWENIQSSYVDMGLWFYTCARVFLQSKQQVSPL